MCECVFYQLYYYILLYYIATAYNQIKSSMREVLPFPPPDPHVDPSGHTHLQCLSIKPSPVHSIFLGQ